MAMAMGFVVLVLATYTLRRGAALHVQNMFRINKDKAMIRTPLVFLTTQRGLWIGRIIRSPLRAPSFWTLADHLRAPDKILLGLRCSTTSSTRPDPFARRPNQICDPYGQGGKPLTLEDAKPLLQTLESEWQLELNDNDDAPVALTREYRHVDYTSGAKFINTLAAVAHVHHHYPIKLLLERRLLPKRWDVVTTVTCQTPTLKGLSRNDFHLAMLMDVETARPEVKRYLVGEEDL